MVRLMNRRTRTQIPTLPWLLIPVVDHNVPNKVLTNKQRQAVNYNKGAKELKSGDTVRLIPRRNPTGESVKARVDNSVETRSYEVVTEDGARYRRNRRHLRKTRESYNRSALTRNLGLAERLVPHGRSQKTSPSKQTERAAVASAVSEQQEAVVPTVCEQQGVCRDPVTLQGQSEPSSQPISVSEFPKTTRSGRVVRRPQYLKDFHTET